MNDTHTQSTRTIIAIFLGFFVISALVGTTWIYFQYVSLQDSRPSSSVAVNGQAKKTIKHDTAKLSFVISKQGENVSELNKMIDETTSKAIAILKSKNISDNDIQTSKSSYPEYSFSPDSKQGEPKLTNTENRISVTISDIQTKLSLPNELTSELTSIGITRFDPYQYETKNIEKICDELKTLAIQDAKEKAKSQIQAIGGKTVIKSQINDQSQCGNNAAYPLPYLSSKDIAVSSERVGGGGLDVFTGERELEQVVNVVFEYR
jgi:uncharacterized protein YggE